MFDFHFVYSDGNTYDVKGVTKIAVKTAGGVHEISGDSILTSKISLGSSIFLYTQNGNVTISGTNLIIIDALKCDN